MMQSCCPSSFFHWKVKKDSPTNTCIFQSVLGCYVSSHSRHLKMFSSDCEIRNNNNSNNALTYIDIQVIKKCIYPMLSRTYYYWLLWHTFLILLYPKKYCLSVFMLLVLTNCLIIKLRKQKKILYLSWVHRSLSSWF